MNSVMLEDLLSELSSKKISGETYYKALELKALIEKEMLPNILISEECLISPFYIDKGTYEMYTFELTIHSTSASPVFLDYINLIENSEDLIAEVTSVFSANDKNFKFDKSNLYVAIY